MKAIIIGGGIAGCSTAFTLTQRGIQTTLIEREAKLSPAASGNPIAVLYPKLTSAPSLQNDLTLAGFEYSLGLLGSLPPNPALFKACGLIQLAHNAREQARQTALLQQNVALDMHAITALQANNHAGVPLGDLNGIYLPQVAWVNPQLWCEALTQNIEKICSTEVLSLNKTPSGWQVNLGASHLQAELVVICNANDVKQFGFCDSAEITAVRGQLNFFKENASSSALKTIVCSDHFISPAVNGWHSVGASYAPNNTYPQVCAKDTANNLAALRKISPKLFESVTQTRARVGWRSQTLDYLPLAGQLLDETALRAKPPRYNANPAELPWLKGLFVNAGHGSKGMMTAPLCGELIACLVSQQALNISPALASKLNPSRFMLRQLGLKQLAQRLCAN